MWWVAIISKLSTLPISTRNCQEIFNQQFITIFRTFLSTEDCFQIGKQLNSLGLYEEGSEWLRESSKHYNEYYDLHQVTPVEILEELAISFINSNQVRQALDVVGKILRIDSNNQITAYIRHKRRDINAVAAPMTTAFVDLCRPIRLLSFLTFTCPIWSNWERIKG